MRPISQNKHAIFNPTTPTRDCIEAKNIKFISKLASVFMLLCYVLPCEKKATSTELQIKIKPLNMPLNVWTFLIESINDAIKIIHNITPNKHNIQGSTLAKLWAVSCVNPCSLYSLTCVCSKRRFNDVEKAAQFQ